MFYVTMIDTFLSGWGVAENKKSRYVIMCETYEEAEVVKENAKNRSDMTKISIVSTRPTYSNKSNTVKYVDKKEAGNWFKPNYFKK